MTDQEIKDKANLVKLSYLLEEFFEKNPNSQQAKKFKNKKSKSSTAK